MSNSKNIPSPHIEAASVDEIAKTVLMPGDPLRAKMIADNFLENVKKFNSVRSMFGYTGDYKGKKVSVMGSGMGMPSIGIYSYELYKFYGVENIIRVGSAGSYVAELDVYDMVLAKSAYSESSFAKVQASNDADTICANEDLNQIILDSANELNINLIEGKIHSSDVFYREKNAFEDLVKEKGLMAVEMESFALFSNAKTLGKKAACILTISDSFVTSKVTSSEERQEKFTKMIEIVLNARIY